MVIPTGWQLGFVQGLHQAPRFSPGLPHDPYDLRSRMNGGPQEIFPPEHVIVPYLEKGSL